MVNVECPSCRAPYSIAKKRIPAEGMKMRCPKCSASFTVTADGGVGTEAAPPKAPRPAGAPQPPASKKPLFAATSRDDALAADGLFGASDVPELGAFGDGVMAAPDDGGFGMLEVGLAPSSRRGSTERATARRDAAPDHALEFSPDVSGTLDDLPEPLGFDDLPAPVGFDDLPAPVGFDDLPAPAGFDRLPAAAGFDNLPAAGVPGANLPVAIRAGAGGGGLDAGAGGFGAKTDLPSAGRGVGPGLPTLKAGAPSPNAQQAALPVAMPGAPPRRGDSVGEEFGVEEADQAGLAPASGRDVGVEDDAAPQVRVKKNRGLRLALAIVPALAIGGGALSVTSAGPYGYYAISDAITRSDNDAALVALAASQLEAAAVDVAGSVDGANTSCSMAQKSHPRFSPMASFCAQRIFVSSLRFGRDLPLEAEGRQLVDAIGVREPGLYLDLARAGKAALDGQLDEALAGAEVHAAEYEGLALAAEIALKARKYDRALTHAESMAKMAPNARSLYALARAQLELGKEAEAVATARNVIKLSANHVGARILLAAALSTKDSTEAQAIALLNEIIKPGAVRDGVSQTELVRAQSMLGYVHLRHSRISAAETAFNAALKLDPRAEDALVGNGELLYEAGRYTDALAGFEAARRVSPRNTQACVGIAKVKLAQELMKEALADLAPLAQSTPDPIVGYWLGRTHIAMGKKGLAEQAFRKAVETGGTLPGVVRAYVALAELLESQGKSEEAGTVLSSAATVMPNSYELHIAQGDAALNAGRLEDAEKQFSKAREIDAQNLAAIFRLAVTLRRGRQFDRAKELYERVAKADPNYPGLALEWGVLFEETGATDRALKMYQDALKRAPDDIDLMLRVGSTQVIGGHAKAAVPLLQQVYNRRRNSAEVNHFLGRAHLLDEEPSKALTFLRNAVRSDPNRAEYQLYLGWAANEAGQAGEAEQAIQRALELDKNLADAYWQRGVLLQRKGKIDEALDDLRTAIAKRPSRFEAYAAMAICYQEKTEYDNALDAWRKAVAGNDAVPEWQFRLAKVLWDRNARAEATKYLISAVDLVTQKLETKQIPSAPRWLWQANFLLGEALRTTDKPRAIEAFRAYLKMCSPDDAYRTDAEEAIKQLGGRI